MTLFSVFSHLTSSGLAGNNGCSQNRYDQKHGPGSQSVPTSAKTDSFHQHPPSVPPAPPWHLFQNCGRDVCVLQFAWNLKCVTVPPPQWAFVPHFYINRRNLQHLLCTLRRFHASQNVNNGTSCKLHVWSSWRLLEFKNVILSHVPLQLYVSFHRETTFH